MIQSKYLDLELSIEGQGPEYRVRATSSVGRAAETFTTPPTFDLVVENFILRLGRTWHKVRRLETSEVVETSRDGDGHSHPVSDKQLSTILHAHPTLRLAVLNACEGARTSREDPFSGLATSLIQQRIPAVVAMQFAVTDRAALTFSHKFYSALALATPA